MAPLLLSLLVGCWKPYADLPPLDFDEVPYSNAYLESADAVISAFDTNLDCPDGSAARFFAVYKKDLEGKAPVAIVLHSGAFDYVVEPDPTGYLNGRHYQGTSRLDRSWAISKVWETLGINPNIIDASENNLGTLPAALTDAGIIQIYPGNCWGDLWHNAQGLQDNLVEVEGFDRNGRTFAYWMIRMIVETSFAENNGFQIPITPDTNQVFLVGLGSGGRGVIEILQSENLPLIKGVVIDSSPDDLQPYLDDRDQFSDVVLGLSRIFPAESLNNVSDWSIPANMALLPERTAFYWSTGDPQQPADTMLGAAQAIEDAGGMVVEVNRSEHVLLNGDIDLANDAVQFLLTGQ